MGIKTVITLYPKRQNKNINERNVYMYNSYNSLLHIILCFPLKNNEKVLKSTSKVSNV